MKIVNYEERFGDCTLPEGFAEILTGLPIEEQMAHYRTTTYNDFSMTGWRSRIVKSGYRRLEYTPDVRALILKDGILVGVMMCNDCGREVPCFAEESVCTYYDDENNGAGYKTRIAYTYLVCLP